MKCCSLTKNSHKEQPLKHFHGYTLDVHVTVSIPLHAFFWCKIHRTWCNKSGTNPMLATPSCNMIPRIQVPQDRRAKATSTMLCHAWCMPWYGIWSGESCKSASNKSKMIYTVYTVEKLRNYIKDLKQIARIGKISTWRTARSNGKDMAASEYQTNKQKKITDQEKKSKKSDPIRWLRSRSLRHVPMCPMECIFVPDGCF